MRKMLLQSMLYYFGAVWCMCVSASTVQHFGGCAESVLLPHPGCHQDVLEHATVLLQTSLHVVGGLKIHEVGQKGQETLLVSSTNRSKLAAALRKGGSSEERVARFQNHAHQAHTNSSSMLAARTRWIRITDHTRFTELKHDMWLWTPMWLLAAAVSCYRQPSKAEKYGSTSALSGFRACLSFWVALEHVGFNFAPAAGAFLILSGAALSTSRISSPGVTKTGSDNLHSYFKFVFLRMARVLPLFWFYVGCLYPDPHCLEWGSKIGNCVLYSSEWRQGRNKPDDMLLFYMNMPGDLINAFLNQTLRMLLLTRDLRQLWFLQAIMFMYIFYPILEALVLGTWRKQPILASHFHHVFLMCCIAKLVEVPAAIWFRECVGWDDFFFNPVARIPDFMLGLLVPNLANPDGKGWIQRAPLVADILLVSLGFVTVFAPLNWVVVDALVMNIQAQLTAFALWGFCYGPSPSPLGRLLSTQFFVRIGEWSYGVFVIHFAMVTQYRLGRKPTNSWGFNGWTVEDWFMPFFVFIVFAKSWSLFVLIETPCSDFARWAIAEGKQPTKMTQCPRADSEKR